MKKVFRGIFAAVITLAVVISAVVFDLPGKISAAAETQKCDGSHTDMTGINDLSVLANGGSFYLTDDINLDSQITITKDVTLCLNGHIIDAQSKSRIFQINGGSLTLCDCKDGGKLIGGNGNNQYSGKGGAVNIEKNSSFIMYGGEISGNTVVGNGGGGVYVNGGTFEMNGGTISDNTVKSCSGGGVYVHSGKFTMNGGTISDNNGTNSNGGGVYVDSGATFEMKDGGIISGNTVTDNGKIENGRGGGVFVNTDANFTMSGGTIGGTSEDSSNNAAFGGGVFVNTDATFTMSGGTISSNTAKYQKPGAGSGGGVYVYCGTFEMSGGSTISDNTAEPDYGGGVIVNGGTFTMSGGMISKNMADSGFGGGVYVRTYEDGENVIPGTFTMTDGIISDNTAQSGGGVYVYCGTFEMSGKSAISNNEAEGAYGGGVNVNGGIFTMKDESTISDNTAKFTGGGVFVSDGTFTMTNGDISGNKSGNGGGVYVNCSKEDNEGVYGIFTMNGGTISGNTAEFAQNNAGNGGGVYVDNSTFTMSGGTISDNTAKYIGDGSGDGAGNGGGVYVCSISDKGTIIQGTFTMTGGTISDNTAENGGGVYVYGVESTPESDVTRKYNGEFTMSGGTISDNTANTNGGGVYVLELGEITLDGAVTIEDNTKTQNPDPSNVYLYNSLITVGEGFSTDSIGVSTNKDPKCYYFVDITKWGSNTTPENISDKFTADISSQGIVNKEGDIVQLNAAHTFGEKWEENETQHWHICLVCNTDVEKGDHEWDDGEVTKEPTPQEDGIMTFNCTICSATKTTPIPMTVIQPNPETSDTSSDESDPASNYDSEPPSDDTPSTNDKNNSIPSDSAPTDIDINPSTGIAISFIPFVAAVTVLTVTIKRKKK